MTMHKGWPDPTTVEWTLPRATVEQFANSKMQIPLNKGEVIHPESEVEITDMIGNVSTHKLQQGGQDFVVLLPPYKVTRATMSAQSDMWTKTMNDYFTRENGRVRSRPAAWRGGYPF